MNQHFQTSFPEDNEHSLNDSPDDGDHFLEEPNSEEENEMEKIELNFPKHPNKKAFHTQIESDSHFRQFYQRQPQHKAATTHQAGKPNSTSPIYNYFGEGNMYLNQKGDDKDEGNVQFNYLKKESLINSPTKSINMEQCVPNYTDFDFFAQQQNFQGNESPIRMGNQMNTNTNTNNNNNVNTQVIENLNNSNNNYNDNYENELGLSPNNVNNMNMNLDLNSFNNSKYQFNDMMKLMSQQTQFHQQQQQQQQQPFNAVVKENSFNNEYINEQYNNQINPYAFANKQINSNIAGLNQINNNNNNTFNLNLYNNSNNNNNVNTNNNNMNIFNNNNNLLGQNMLNVFNNTNNINNIFNSPFIMNNQHTEYNQQQFPKQHQQQQPLKREDYIFEKFGKKGWQCNHCNNFNFESKLIHIHIYIYNNNSKS